MARIAVFDSGLGSLSVIKAIQKIIKSEIIYFADQKNFPYGKKTERQLGQIIHKTVKRLQDFKPDVIVMASNTPSLMVGHDKQVIGVYPPIREAAEMSKTQNIAILGTRSAITSKGLDNYIAKQNISHIVIHKIDASSLVELVENGKFLTDVTLCRKRINNLAVKLKGVDVATLSSTHLSFLKPLLRDEFSGIKFLDPADIVAKKVQTKIKNQSKRNRLLIYTNGDSKLFEKNLAALGIKNKVNHIII